MFAALKDFLPLEFNVWQTLGLISSVCQHFEMVYCSWSFSAKVLYMITKIILLQLEK